VQSASIQDSRTMLRSPASWLLVAICLPGLLWSCTLTARASGPALNSQISFDIPAQPLDQALDAFGAVSGLQIFYESALTAGRHSSELKGSFDPQGALRILLRGSDLTARVIATGTLSIAKLADAEINEARRQTEVAYFPYFGLLQAGVMKVLCSRPETRPGNYHIALQYWIDVRGKIARLRLIGSSGTNERDAAIMDAVQGLTLPPPGNMPQPVTMAIEPVQQIGCPTAVVDDGRGR
jgi:hypothetical protein